MVVSIDKAVIARLQHSGQRFEILVDPNRALDFKRGTKVDVGEILAYPAIYRDVRSTEMAPESDLQKAFGTTDYRKIAERIIKEGELQLTTEQRRTMVEQKKNQIASIISRKGTNPQTNTPHPPQRIINAMDQAGVNIDPFMEAEMQVDKIVKAIREIIPIKFQNVTIQVKISPQFAAKVYSVLKASGTIINEQWLNDGSLQVQMQILAGLQEEVFQKIASATHGQFESKILKREDI